MTTDDGIWKLSMTADERVEHIRRVLPLADAADARSFCRFLLAELDASRQQVATLREALKQLAENAMTDDNTASVSVAAQRVRNIARRALTAGEDR